VLALLTTFLAGWGRDLPASALAGLHGALRPWLRHAWGASRQPRLREALACYCRLQLQLGGVQVRPRRARHMCRPADLQPVGPLAGRRLALLAASRGACLTPLPGGGAGVRGRAG
jgi:hypothetical protein